MHLFFQMFKAESQQYCRVLQADVSNRLSVTWGPIRHLSSALQITG